MKKLTLTILIGLSHFAYAQDINESNDVDEIIEDLLDLEETDLLNLIDDLDNYHYIFAATDFSSKSFFLGRDLGIDQYNVVTQVSYENHLGIFIGVSGTYYSEFDPQWDLTVLSAGYGLDINKSKSLRTELEYNRYIFSNSSSNDFENSLDLSLSYTTANSAFSTNIVGSYLFGDKTGFQTSVNVFGNIKLFDLDYTKGSKINFEPSLAFILGSENLDTSRIDNLGIDIPFINNIVNELETFSLRNTQLKLPLVADFYNLSLEAGINFNFPTPFDFENDTESSTFFNFGVNYIFDLN